MAEITITKDNFEAEVLQSALPVLVDFWAPWCGPCRALAPTVAQIAEEYDGRIRVGKVNVDEEGELAEKYGISGIPAVLLFRGGEVLDTSVGVCPKSRLVAMFDAL